MTCVLSLLTRLLCLLAFARLETLPACRLTQEKREHHCTAGKCCSFNAQLPLTYSSTYMSSVHAYIYTQPRSLQLKLRRPLV